MLPARDSARGEAAVGAARVVVQLHPLVNAGLHAAQDVAGVDPLHLAQFPHQRAELDGVPLTRPAGAAGGGGGEGGGGGGGGGGADISRVLTAPTASTHPAVPTKLGRRVGKVHPPGPQAGALDAAGGGGRVLQYWAPAGQAVVLSVAQLTPGPSSQTSS